MSYLTIELYDNKKDSEDDYPMHVIATNNTPSECCKMTRDDIKRALNARIIARLTPSTSITYNDFAWVINHEIAHVRQNMNKLTMVIQRIEKYRRAVNSIDPYSLEHIASILCEIDAECEALRFTPRDEKRGYLDFIYDECPLWVRISMLADGYIAYSLFAYDDA